MSPQPKHQILVVDDNAINRMILNKILSDTYQVVTAENGQQALDICEKEKEHISLIILDVLMPVMDGYTCLAHLKEDSQLSTIPVIIAAQQDSETDEVKALSCGANDYVTKPYKPEIVLKRVENLIKLRENAALINMMEKDSLTGCLAKDYFYQKITALFSDPKGEPFNLAVADINNFKIVNDLYGTKNGDAVLKILTEILSQRSQLVGRLGADIFAFTVPQKDSYENEDFRSIVTELNGKLGLTLSISISFGIYKIHDTNVGISLMCDRARLAAKSIKGTYLSLFSIYDDRLRMKMLTEQRITESMETAIKEHQFVVYYQSKTNIRDNKLSGAEALVRWISPSYGFMSPGDFIPLFERNGFITKLDMYVWNQVAEDIATWIKEGKPVVPISVNVSRADFYLPNLPDIIAGIIKEHDIPVEYLHLEVTESAYMNNPHQIISQVTLLKRMGIAIEMDDFGTGYSSLNMLSELPIDYLKLDMNFIQKGLSTPKTRSIISFIISLAHWLNLVVIAEGIETLEQVNQLKEMDCTYAQGYYFSKPVPKDVFEQILLTWKIDASGQAEKLHEFPKEIICKKTGTDHPAILIIEDANIDKQVLAGMLEEEYQIFTANDGTEGYEALRKHKAEIVAVLCDFVMPVCDGMQFLTTIRQNPEFADLPVIITSQESENVAVRSLENGANDIISKPYCKEIVRSRVRNVILASKQ